MARRTRLLVTATILALGVIAWLALTVYPFDYGPVESLVLVAFLVVAGYVELVLDEALTGS